MGIALGSNFSMNAALPLDDRSRVADISARNAIPSGKRWEGMIVYVVSAKTNYQLVGGIIDINWQELSGGGSGAGPSGSTTKKYLLVNNLANTLAEIGDYLAESPAIIVEYYLYRRTDDASASISGAIRFESKPEEALSVNRWAIFESLRSEVGESGVTFSLSEEDTEKSVLVVNLDNMAGDNHLCKMYCKVTRLTNDTGKIIILDNNSINPISSIGENLTDAGSIIVDYFIYRRTNLGFKTLSGKIFLEGNDDAATNPEKWQLLEAERSESAEASGVTFSLDDVATGKSILVITLDSMAGSDHRCDFYFNKTVLVN